ncbi:M16 family metallopeptidase [Phenylobacterium sp.]|uniref:M16 family metallopeptidase n=1 Tax=Phenylobacterium sp. TaxID=1871053 RepID=UPI0039839C2D
MTRSLRAGLALSAALSLVLGASAFAQAPAVRLAPGQWPQAVSDIRADPNIRFGALPNGMRYAIRKQSIPPGQGALRLRFDAGSMMETDAQQGLAHFLEHMAFNGSKGVKEGEMIKILERLGLAFGADTNASTGFSETVYKLDLPRTNDETVDTSLMLLREAAGNLSIDAAAVDRERGVVLSEERSRDTPAFRVFKERLAFLLPGQRLPTRYPIGTVEVLKTAPPSQLQAFYAAYYRPERAVLVAVGDFDVAAMEAKIRARFSDWKAVGPAGGDPDQGAVRPRRPEARLVVEPGAAPSLQIAWIAPPDHSPDTLAKRRGDLLEGLGFAVLNRRLSSISRAPSPPFLGAGGFKNDQDDAAEVTMMAVNAEPGRWREALSAVEQEQRRAVRYGVRQDELDREIEEVRTNLKTAVAGAATRRQTELAEEIVGSVADDQVVTAPADDLVAFEAAVKGLQAETVSTALKAAFTGQGPIVFMSSPKPVEGGEPALLAALVGSQQVAVAAPAAPAQVAWPYGSFGPAGKVAERREVTDMGATFIRFANGVRLTVKPTKFRDDEVLVRVNVGDGLLDLPKDRQSANWASGAYIEGGLKQISAEDMERALASKVYGARFGIGDDNFVFTGSTRPQDLATQMQVLAAYLAEPGWRPEAFQRLKGAGKSIHDQYEATTSGVIGRDLAGLLHNGDRRWTFPSREEIAAARLEDLQGQIMPNLASGPVEVVMVGDITVDQAIEAAARTFAALPARPAVAALPAAQRQVGFPAGVAQPVALTHKGRADQAVGYIGWPTSDYWSDPQRARETAVMSEVMSLRLLDELREAQGATYSPQVGVNHSLVWTGWGYVAASVEVPPEKLDAFFTDARKIAADLRTKDVTADELTRAKKPRIERLEKARVSNPYWLAELSGAQEDPRRLEAIRQSIPGATAVTIADVKRAAALWLKDDKAYMLVVKPQQN